MTIPFSSSLEHSEHLRKSRAWKFHNKKMGEKMITPAQKRAKETEQKKGIRKEKRNLISLSLLQRMPMNGHFNPLSTLVLERRKYGLPTALGIVRPPQK